MMGQQTQGHMMMPAQPTPHLVMVQAQPSFALLEGRFDGPPHASDPDQRGHWCVGWRIAKVDFQFRLFPYGPPPDDPHVGARQPSAYRHSTLEGELGDQGPFTALFDQVRVPRFWRQRRGELINALRGRLPRDQAHLAGPSAPTRPRRHSRRWPLQPDPRVVGHFRIIPPLQSRHTVQERGLAAKGFIARHPAQAHRASLHYGLQHLQGQGWLGLEQRVLGDATLVPPLTVRRIEPLVGQIQPPVKQRIPFAAGIGGEHPRLTILDLAQAAAPLARHPDRMLALLGKLRAIDDAYAVRFAQRLVHQGPVLPQHCLIWPLALSNTLLHSLDVPAVQRKRHRLNRLALDRQQQSLQILVPPMGLFLAIVQICKSRMVVHQLIGQRCDLFWPQVQRRGGLIDLDNPKIAHSHPLLPRYGWRVVYYRSLEKSRCSTSLSNNGVIHYPFTCLDAAARKKMHSNAAGLSRPNSPARLYSYSVP